MTGFLKAVFGQPLGTTGKAPSFNDFSLHVADDAENELDGPHEASPLAPAPEPVNAKRTNVWQDTFSPQMNSNLKRLPKSYYDAPQQGHNETVWDHIIKADTIRQVAFHHFDKNQDGMIDAEDLRASLGGNADVEDLIRKADKNHDGKIDQAEFCEMLKNM